MCSSILLLSLLEANVFGQICRLHYLRHSLRLALLQGLLQHVENLFIIGGIIHNKEVFESIRVSVQDQIEVLFKQIETQGTLLPLTIDDNNPFFDNSSNEHVLFNGMQQGAQCVEIVNQFVLFEVDSTRQHVNYWRVLIVSPERVDNPVFKDVAT